MSSSRTAGNGADTGPETREDLVLIRDAVHEAGRIALRFFGQNPSVERKADGTAVSEADYAVDRALRDELTGARPGYGWLSEETEDDKRRLDCERVWIVDPIDGTRAFLKEKPEWTISAALVEAGRPVIGVVFNPVTDEFFEAVRGRGTLLNDQPVAVREPVALKNCRLAASQGLLRRDMWSQPWPPVDIRWVNSIAYRMALVSTGELDGTISLSAKHDWDLAAAELLVQEAGGVVTSHKGETFSYNGESSRQESVIAAGPSLHGELLARCREAHI